MGYRIRADFALEDGRQASTTLYRKVGEQEDGTPIYSDARTFMAGAVVPSDYVVDALRERLKDADDPIHRTLEVVDGVVEDYSSLSSTQLDEKLADAGLSVTEGSGKDGNVVKDDKLKALASVGPSEEPELPTTSDGGFLSVVPPPATSLDDDNPFA